VWSRTQVAGSSCSGLTLCCSQHPRRRPHRARKGEAVREGFVWIFGSSSAESCLLCVFLATCLVVAQPLCSHAASPTGCAVLPPTPASLVSPRKRALGLAVRGARGCQACRVLGRLPFYPPFSPSPLVTVAQP
jgi:hypothetical protein